jgi:hypothetical protein
MQKVEQHKTSKGNSYPQRFVDAYIRRYKWAGPNSIGLKKEDLPYFDRMMADFWYRHWRINGTD